LTATPGNAQVALSWTAPTSDGGSPITGFRIYRGTSSATKVILATVGTVTTYSDTTVTNGTTYYYEVSTLNAIGESVRSNEASAKPSTTPSAPRNLSAKPDRTRGVNLKWAAPSSNGGSAVTGYRIYRSTSSGTETFLVAVAAVTGYRDTANTVGVRYYYRITAVNIAGEGPLSSESSAVAK
jgi:fibronectin type 3 domain-containing protein